MANTIYSRVSQEIHTYQMRTKGGLAPSITRPSAETRIITDIYNKILSEIRKKNPIISTTYECQ